MSWLLTELKLLRVPWTARRSKQSILKKINSEYYLEGLMLKLKLQYFGHLMQRANSHWKNPWCWEQKGTTEDEMAGCHHQLDGHGFEQAPGDGEGLGSLACCSPWGRKVSEMPEPLSNKNWNSLGLWPPVQDAVDRHATSDKVLLNFFFLKRKT